MLHYHSERCKIVILERDLAASPALSALRGESAAAASEQDDEKEVAIEGVETWVTSE